MIDASVIGCQYKSYNKLERNGRTGVYTGSTEQGSTFYISHGIQCFSWGMGLTYFSQLPRRNTYWTSTAVTARAAATSGGPTTKFCLPIINQMPEVTFSLGDKMNANSRSSILDKLQLCESTKEKEAAKSPSHHWERNSPCLAEDFTGK